MSLKALLTLGTTLLDKFVADPQAKATHALRLAELAQKGDESEMNAYVTLMAGQLEINKEEAKSGSLFIAGWRPAIGWISAIALAAAFIPKALVMTVLWSAQSFMMLKGCELPACDLATFILPPFPEMGLTDLFGIVGAMLGIGTMRSIDKAKRTDTKLIG